MNIYSHATVAYHIKDTIPSSYSTFIVKYNRINIISCKNKILKLIYIDYLLYKYIFIFIFYSCSVDLQ